MNLDGKGDIGLESFGLYYADLLTQRGKKVIARTSKTGIFTRLSRKALNVFS